MNSNAPISEQLYRAGMDWADKNAAANLLEETKSATLSQMMSQHSTLPISRAEMMVKSSAEWMQFIQKMVDARHKADLAKVRLEYLRARFQEWQSAEANHRVQARA